jgi:DNA-binding CsgD family transcriptional regulator
MSFAPRGQRASDNPLADPDPHAQTTVSTASRSVNQRKILFFRAAGLDSAQTGEVMGMSAGTVRVAMHRARVKWRAEQQSSATQDSAKLDAAHVEKMSPFLKFVKERPSSADDESSS